ncbi:MAG: NAD(P)-dependent oxidoreductase [Ignavibacteriales bacterium]|nr:NAD(P)-dependent oxidoreductase [Ignavibacteriales bacterium]
MNILVTGGSGTVGKYIVDDLIRHKYTVGVADIVPPKRKDIRYHHCNLLNLDDVCDAVMGYDVVVHTAGIPHPLNDPPEKIFTVNVNGTFNVLEASARGGIKKVVFTSSESTLGFAFMTNRMVPEYIPIDEQHPVRPQDPYGLSKIVAEQICKTYSARYGIRTICLREPWIWVPEEEMISFYKQLVEQYPNWHKNLWTYVHVFDVAQAHRLAIEKDLEQFHEIFFITAKENWTGKDSRELLARHYPEVRQFSPLFSGAQAIISHEKAKRLLGYEPTYSRKDLW